MDGEEISSGSEASDDSQPPGKVLPEDFHWNVAHAEVGSCVRATSEEADVDADLDYDEELRDEDDCAHSVVSESHPIIGGNGTAISSDDEDVYDEEAALEEEDRVESTDVCHTEECCALTDEVKCEEDVSAAESGAELTKANRVHSEADERDSEAPDGDHFHKEEEPCEEGEIDDLEEGELRSDDEEERCEDARRNTNSSQSPARGRRGDGPAAVGVCKFYLRGACTWGPDCKFLHPTENTAERMSAPQQNFEDGAWSDRSRTRERPSIHSRVTYPTLPAGDAATESDLRGRSEESAWERGVREAKLLLVKAYKKREQEPDFDQKRLVLAPSDDVEHTRTTDDDSDDSRISRRMLRRKERISPEGSDIVRGSAGINSRVGVGGNRSMYQQRYDDDTISANSVPLGCGGRYAGEYGNVEERGRMQGAGGSAPRSSCRRIPSLIDNMKEGRFFELPKDLGPQVIYPNGRPDPPSFRKRDSQSRRHDRQRNQSPGARYYCSRRESRSRSRRSRSLSARPSRSSRTSSLSPPPRRVDPPSSWIPVNDRRNGPPLRKHQSDSFTGVMLSGGEPIRDPWDRSAAKRNHGREFASTTLGSVLQNARRSDEINRANRRDLSASKSPELSRTNSPESCSSSNSRGSSRDRRPSTRPSLASAVPLKSLFDDDGSMRPTDLSSFRIPKKKKSSTTDESLQRSNSTKRESKNRCADKGAPRGKKSASPVPQKRRTPNSPRCVAQGSRGGKTSREGVQGGIRRKLSESNEKISSTDSSSSSSSSDDDNEPAAYRRKRAAASDDGLPTEGIPLSPEATVVDVSSEDEDAVKRFEKQGRKRSRSLSRSVSPVPRSLNFSPRRTTHEKGEEDVPMDDRFDQFPGDHRFPPPTDDYVDNDKEKEERRESLLRQLRCVEEAIARKRNRPNP